MKCIKWFGRLDALYFLQDALIDSSVNKVGLQLWYIALGPKQLHEWEYQLSPLATFKLLVSSHFQPSPILTDIFLSYNVHSQLKTTQIKFLNIQSHLKTPHTTWIYLALVYRSYFTFEENNSIILPLQPSPRLFSPNFQPRSIPP